MKITKLFFLASVLMLCINSASAQRFDKKKKRNKAAAKTEKPAAQTDKPAAQLKWVKYKGELPSNTVIGGVESHRSLPICRCEYKGAKHPGKVVEKACNIGYGGVEKAVINFEILVNNSIDELHWIKTDGSSLPKNAIMAGKENGLALYVGRVYHKGGTHPGKVFKAGNKYICNIGYGGKEITLNTFEVLVKHKHTQHVFSPLEHHNVCGEDHEELIHAVKIGSMNKEQQLNEGQSLIAPSLKFQTRVTNDGRLVIEEVISRALCEDGRLLVFEMNEIWANTQEGRDPSKDYYLKFQEDGNLCIYSKQDGFVWCSMSNGREGDHFEITNIGHIEIVNDHGGEVWPD